MSSNVVSDASEPAADTPVSLAALAKPAAIGGSHPQGGGGASSSTGVKGSGSPGGVQGSSSSASAVQVSSNSSGSIYASLLQALIETVTPSGTAASAVAAGTGTASTVAAAAGTPATAASIAIQGLDVQAFLHHLFGALRQAGAPPTGAVESEITTTPAVSPAPGFAAAIAAAPTFATPIAAAPFASTPTETSVAGSPESTVVGSDAASPYRQQDVVSALQYLVTNLDISQAIEGVSGSGLSASTIASLNTSFTKLIGDLNGAGEAGSSTAPRTAATSTIPETAALQSFLSTFLQHLKINQVSATNALGGTVNATV
jgi:hypothetical protein